jgi:hypothetical protein
MSVDHRALFRAGHRPATLLLGPMPAQHCIQARAHRRNTASAPFIQTRSPGRAPTITRSLRLDGFWHPPRQGQIAIARGAFPTSTPRGFLPWGFPTTAPVPAPLSRCAVVRNPSHKRSSPEHHNHGEEKRSEGIFSPVPAAGIEMDELGDPMNAQKQEVWANIGQAAYLHRTRTRLQAVRSTKESRFDAFGQQTRHRSDAPLSTIVAHAARMRAVRASHQAEEDDGLF